MLPDGRTLREDIAADPEGLLGPGRRETGMLMKLIDAAERLSVQAHPTRADAMRFFQSPFRQNGMLAHPGRAQRGRPASLHLFRLQGGRDPGRMGAAVLRPGYSRHAELSAPAGGSAGGNLSDSRRRAPCHRRGLLPGRDSGTHRSYPAGAGSARPASRCPIKAVIRARALRPCWIASITTAAIWRRPGGAGCCPLERFRRSRADLRQALVDYADTPYFRMERLRVRGAGAGGGKSVPRPVCAFRRGGDALCRKPTPDPRRSIFRSRRGLLFPALHGRPLGAAAL